MQTDSRFRLARLLASSSPGLMAAMLRTCIFLILVCWISVIRLMPARADGGYFPIKDLDAAREPTDLQHYKQNLQYAITENWTPPGITKPMQATAYLQINSTGKLISARISKSSGDPAVDGSILSAVSESQPFEPLPNVVSGTVYVRVTFECDPGHMQSTSVDWVNLKSALP